MPGWAALKQAFEQAAATTGHDEEPPLDAAAIAALRTVVHGGLIPQFRHGGRGVDALAVARSKFDGTGLPKEQMGQIHVALGGLGVDIDGGRNGLALLDDGGDKWLGVGALIGA